MKYLILLLLPFLSLNVSGKSQQTLSPATYESLNEIQELVQQENWPEAEENLESLSKKLRPGFGLALTYQLHGQLHLAKEENKQALKKFEQALELNALAPAQESALSTNVAQLYLADGKTRQSINTLTPRLNNLLSKEKDASKGKSDKPKRYVQPMAMVTLATAYQLQKDFSQSILWLERAIQRDDNPRENWLQMLMSAYYQTKDYNNAIKILSRLQAINPAKEDYWLQQASLYQLNEQSGQALIVMETAYAGGYLSKENSLLLLVQLLINHGIPERGARILQQQIKAGVIEIDEQDWRLLASAWQQGRERSRAAAALRKAAEDMEGGSLLYRAAQLNIQDNNYREALTDLEAALDKGLSDKRKGTALILAGNSAFELKDLATAKRYFHMALNEPGSASSARVWLDYISSIEEYL